jgi:uncharacterized protein YjbI with pentapeptide repeats
MGDFPMANNEHVALLKQGAAVWNEWRLKNPDVRPNLMGANLNGTSLSGPFSEPKFTYLDLLSDGGRPIAAALNLSEANLGQANLNGASLVQANLCGANLRAALLNRADLSNVVASAADFSHAELRGATLNAGVLVSAKLMEADLEKAELCANLMQANLSRAHLNRVNFTGAGLGAARLDNADLTRANLTGAILRYASLVKSDLRGADLTGCDIYGVSAWGLELEGTKQQNLIITDRHEPAITVDNIEVAQFIYLLLHNQKIRDVIDTVTSKAVLILGRFTAERKAVLDALREELRKRDYLPILFDFDKPGSKDLTGTVTTLANMVRFVIADGTDPKSIPHELATIAPTTIVPVKPILLASEREYSMFADLQRRYHWVLPTHRYGSQEQLIADLDLCVIRPAVEKAEELRKDVFK